MHVSHAKSFSKISATLFQKECGSDSDELRFKIFNLSIELKTRKKYWMKSKYESDYLQNDENFVNFGK